MVFPGQGSQSVGMQADLAERYAVVRDTYAEAGDALGYDLWSLVQEGPAEELNATEVTQPAMLAAGVAAWRAWQARDGGAPQTMAGHSLGEYSALVCAGALELSAAAPLVRSRGRLMQQAVAAGEGAMAAILGLDDEAVIGICAQAAGSGVVEAVNFNSPGQVVVSGATAAVENAVELAKQAGARRAVLLKVSAPMHSSLLEPAGEQLAAVLADTEFRRPAIDVLSSTELRPYRDADDIRELLSRQVSSPVLWTDTVRALAAAGADRLVECGPGKVLTGLARRIDRGLEAGSIEDPQALDELLAGMRPTGDGDD